MRGLKTKATMLVGRRASQREFDMSNPKHVPRRAALLGGAATALPLVHIRTAGAAGKLALGFWDHWVPQANDTLRQQVEAWAAQNKVDATIDFITSSGGKLMLTAAAEY